MLTNLECKNFLQDNLTDNLLLLKKDRIKKTEEIKTRNKTGKGIEIIKKIKKNTIIIIIKRVSARALPKRALKLTKS